MEFDTDLSLFYADFGLPVTHTSALTGVVTIGKGIHDLPGVALLGNEMVGTEHSLRYARAIFPDVRKGDSIAINGVGYIAREAPQNLPDGTEAIAFLRSA